jgi:hypothetical protein
VGGKEHVEDVSISNQGRIEYDLNYFGVTGVAGANVLVGGSLHVAAHISGYYGVHAPQLFVDSLHAPKAAPAECRRCHIPFDSTAFRGDPKTKQGAVL